MPEGKLCPLFLIKPGTVSRKDIRRAERFCGICIVECAEPESARYSEPPLGADLDEQARAALSLMRMIISSPSPDFKRGDLTKWFVNEILTHKRPENVPPVKTMSKEKG
jgi:hypothetical protein